MLVDESCMAHTGTGCGPIRRDEMSACVVGDRTHSITVMPLAMPMRCGAYDPCHVRCTYNRDMGLTTLPYEVFVVLYLYGYEFVRKRVETKSEKFLRDGSRNGTSGTEEGKRQEL